MKVNSQISAKKSSCKCKMNTYFQQCYQLKKEIQGSKVFFLKKKLHMKLSNIANIHVSAFHKFEHLINVIKSLEKVDNTANYNTKCRWNSFMKNPISLPQRTSRIHHSKGFLPFIPLLFEKCKLQFIWQEKGNALDEMIFQILFILNLHCN